MTDENITWEDHIQTVEKKLAKNLGLLYLPDYLLDNDSLKLLSIGIQIMLILHGEVNI